MNVSLSGTMHVYVNGEDQGVAARNLPRAMLAVFDLFGAVESVSLCSSAFVPSRHTPNCYEVWLIHVKSLDQDSRQIR